MNTSFVRYGIIGAIILAIVGFAALYFLLPSSQNTPGEEADGGGLFSFLGFGQSVFPGNNNFPEENTGTTTSQSGTLQLRQLTEGPVAGVVATTTKDGSVARYIERSTGHVYDAVLDTSEKIRVSNTTFPRIQEVLWFPGAEGVVLRYFDDHLEKAETFTGNIKKELSTSTDASPYTLDGIFLDPGIRTIAVSAAEKKVVYIAPAGTPKTFITVKADGTGKTQIFSTPVAEWLVQWFSRDSLALTTKPSGTTVGYMYTLPAAGGSLTKRLGGRLGLTTLVSPKGDRSIFSEVAGGTITLGAVQFTSGSETTLPVATLSDKCVWSVLHPTIAYCGVPRAIPGGTYPDDWYTGTVSFSDDLWSIDTEKGFASLVVSTTDYTQAGIDAVDLSLSKNEDSLVFKNKKDASVWVLQLPDPNSELL